MIPSLRQRFNAGFTPQKYRDFLDGLDRACGTHVAFRNSETPCFLPKVLVERLVADGRELIEQLISDPEYRRRSEAAIPPEFRVPGETDHPLFANKSISASFAARMARSSPSW